MAWAVLAALATLNVTMMVQGATGYVVLGGLALLFGYGLGRWRGFAIGLVAVAAAAAVLTYVPGPFQQRVGMVEREFRGWQAADAQSTSIGLRLEFYHNTLRIIRDHPVAGVGTGGFPQAYARVVEGSGMAPTRNPHNEFLHLAVQVGPLGVAALLWLLLQQWRLAARLGLLEKEIARGVVVLMAIGCMLNSLLLDHTEGLLYAWLTGLLYAGLESRRRIVNGKW
jgi:O-antigen ligase